MEPLRKKCKTRKMLITKMVTQITLAIQDPESSLQKLEGLLSNYQRRMKELQENFEEILDLLGDENLEEEIDSQHHFTSEKEDLCYTLIEHIDKIKAKTGSSSLEQDEDVESISSKKNDMAEAKMPKLNINVFDGEIESWEQFYENFKENVHNKELPDTQKFSYLQSYLQGEALEVIKGFPLASYQEAWNLLKENYSKPERIALRHIASLINLSLPSNAKGPGLGASLKTMLNKIQMHLRSLNNLGPLKAETILCPWIVSKFPEAVALEWGRQSKGKESDLQYTIEFLKGEIYRSDFTSDVKLMQQAGQKIQSTVTATPKGTAVSLHTIAHETAPTAPPSSKPKCAGCHRPGHHIRECRKFKSLGIETRNDIARRAKLCWRCLKNKHPCMCTSQCSHCSGGHNILLCRQKINPQKPPAGASASAYSMSPLCGAPMNPYSYPGSQQHGTQAGPHYQGPQGPQGPQGSHQQGSQQSHLQQGPQQGFQRAVGAPTWGARNGSFQTSQPPPQQPQQPNQFQVTSQVSLASTESHGAMVTMLQLAQAEVRTKNGEFVPITILLDSGADRSFVRSDLAIKAKCKEVGKVNIAYSSFGGEREPKAKLRSVLELDIRGISGEVFSVQAVGVDNICQPIKTAALSGEAIQAFKHLNPLTTDYSETSVSTISLLIGLDQYWSMINEHYTVRHNNLVAQATRFGYIISGSYISREVSNVFTNVSTQYENPITPTQLLILDLGDQRAEQIWKLDQMGITPTESRDTCLTQDPVYQQLLGELEYNPEIKKYKAPLLWKSEGHKLRLASNVKQAEARLRTLHRRTLDPDPELKQEYYGILWNWIHEGKAEIIPDDELTIIGQPTYYMPHRPILRPHATSSKVRPVFDASSKCYTGYSLNDVCHTGPSLLPLLVGVLLRFRRWPWVISGDVKQAFLNIYLHERDRDAHRFLIKYGDKILHCRFTVVPFGNTCSPFLLNAILKFHFKQYGLSEASQELLQNVYIDNILSGADSQEEAEQLYQIFCSIFADAGMTLDKWDTNAENLQCRLLIDNKQSTNEKVLGVEWDKGNDSFIFKGIIHSEIKCLLQNAPF